MYNKDTTKFTVDWLNIRLDDVLPNEFINNFCEIYDLDYNDILPRDKGVCFYKKGYYLPSVGYSSIVFAYNEDEDGNFVSEAGERQLHGLLVSVTGDGCRWLQHRVPDGMRLFCELCSSYPHNCTRIDISCDFLDKDNKVVPMIQNWGLHFYDDTSDIAFSSNLRMENPVDIHLVYDNVVGGITPNITVGGRNSTKGQMQLYNKRVEMQSGRLSELKEQMFGEYGVEDYWYRLEYRCKSFGNYIFDNLVQNGLYKAFLCAAEYFGRFYEPVYQGNSDKCPTIIDWAEFLNAVYLFISSNSQSEEIPFVSQPYVKPEVARTMRYVNQNPAFISLIVHLAMSQPEWFKEQLKIGERLSKENLRYKAWWEDFNANWTSSSVPEYSIQDMLHLVMDI